MQLFSFVFLSYLIPDVPEALEYNRRWSFSLVREKEKMQYQSWGSRSSEEMAMHGQSGGAMMSPLERVERLAAENAVVVFSMSSCCMCHVIKRLFCSLGVNPTVYELDEESHGKDMEKALVRLVGGGAQAVPAVFVGGKLVGGMDRVMACHINGTLVPLLKEAGALWL